MAEEKKEKKKTITPEEIREALKEVYDPEIPVNIVDLGLIYGLEIQDGKVKVVMTLTAPGCPIWPMIEAEVKNRILALEGVEDVEVQFVWDPPWNLNMISEEGRAVLRSLGFNV